MLRRHQTTDRRPGANRPVGRSLVRHASFVISHCFKPVVIVFVADPEVGEIVPHKVKIVILLMSDNKAKRPMVINHVHSRQEMPNLVGNFVWVPPILSTIKNPISKLISKTAVTLKCLDEVQRKQWIVACCLQYPS